MKKHNEGYALPFVLVVFLIISLVATSVLTVSLRNLQSQKASIQRMEEQYVAAGAIEIVMAKLCDKSVMSPISGTFAPSAFEDKLVSVCSSVYDTEDENFGNSLKVDSAVELGLAVNDTDNTFAYKFGIVSTSGEVQIFCSATLRGSCTSSRYEDTTIYSLDALTITYDSYTVEVIEATASTESTGGDT